MIVCDVYFINEKSCKNYVKYKTFEIDILIYR